MLTRRDNKPVRVALCDNTTGAIPNSSNKMKALEVQVQTLQSQINDLQFQNQSLQSKFESLQSQVEELKASSGQLQQRYVPAVVDVAFLFGMWLSTVESVTCNDMTDMSLYLLYIKEK